MLYCVKTNLASLSIQGDNISNNSNKVYLITITRTLILYSAFVRVVSESNIVKKIGGRTRGNHYIENYAINNLNLFFLAMFSIFVSNVILCNSWIKKVYSIAITAYSIAYY